jgi:hypothetical protein
MKDAQNKTEPNYITAGLIEALAELIYRYLKTKENDKRGI